MTAIETLPKVLLVRTPRMDDLQAVYELVRDCDLADNGIEDFTLEDFRSAWQEPDFDLASDGWVVVTPEGRLVGYADTMHRSHARIYAFMRVHPDYRGLGIEKYLLHMAEERAQRHIAEAAPGVRVSLGVGISHNDQASGRLLEEEGYVHIRSSWRMGIEMDQPPPEPVWPDGISVRTFIPGEERAVFEMIDEAFQDHWGHMPGVFEQWEHWMIKRGNFDPTLWFLAVDGDTLAGGALCSDEKELGVGWVSQLAVRRPWRRKGLAMALLLQAFGEFYRRGIHKVGLGVDSQNLTGATRLYQRAGMHVVLQYDTYEKELRAGQELSTQSIDG